MARRLFLVLFGLLLSACAPMLDSGQARICRMALPVLEPEGTDLRILRQSALREDFGVRIDYRTAHPTRGWILHWAECRFDGGLQSMGRLDLRSITSDRGQMRPANLYLLKRFWLETPDALDPAPVEGAGSVPRLGAGTAYFLQQVINGLPLAAIYALLAAAYALIYGLIGRINLAFGELAAIGGYAAGFGVMLFLHAPPFTMLAFATVIGTGAALMHGAVSARMVFAPLQRATGQQALVATIGLSIFLQEYLRLSQGNALRWVSPILAQPFALAGGPDFLLTATPVGLLTPAAALLAAVVIVRSLAGSQFGRNWRAFSDDPLAAMMLGVSPGEVFFKTFAIASALAGFAGVLLTLYFGGVGFNASTALGLKALIAAILGGIGSVPGALLGGLAIGLAESFWAAYFPAAWRDVVIYGSLAVILIFRPGGFFGSAALPARRW